MDFTLSGILSSLLVGSVGYVLFHYGKRSVRTPQLVSGLVLMVFPTFVSNLSWMFAITALVLAGLWACLRAGL